ncbi:MAG TPA: hypothetical protein PLL69_05010 [Gemmatimonadales bacterium]|nr:hypothetical protein [Gemmatimonadales bacterium]
MSDHIHQVTVVLAASADDATRVPGILTEFNHAQRLLRALTVIGVALVMAAMLIPVPIVHLVGIPLVFIIGIGVAVRQYRAVARLEPVRIACPKCGAENSIGGGLGYRSATGPIARACESCRRSLELSFH